MQIMALDLATCAGFAIGRAGGKPRSGSRRLKGGDDAPERAFRKLGLWLRDEFSFEKPDLVVCEAPVNLGAFVEGNQSSPKGFRFKSNASTIYMLQGFVAIAHGICGPYGVRCINANVQTVRKHFLGKARPENPKLAVLDRCRLLGYVDRDFADTDAGDAIALWDYACATYGRVAPAALHLFGEGARG
jgi:hypothetical protein